MAIPSFCLRLHCKVFVKSRRLQRRPYCSVKSTPPVRHVSSSVTCPRETTVMTIFRWPGALNSKQVSVTGTFSDWNPVELHQAPDGGDFYRSFRIPIGAHEVQKLNSKFNLFLI